MLFYGSKPAIPSLSNVQFSLICKRSIENGQVCGVTLANGEFIPSHHVVLAVGHSARDTFEMLHRQGVYIEAKPFSIGFRVEHPQDLIDKCRLGSQAGHPMLGAADYSLVHHCSNGRSALGFVVGGAIGLGVSMGGVIGLRSMFVEAIAFFAGESGLLVRSYRISKTTNAICQGQY
jgi:hypothetical protein